MLYFILNFFSKSLSTIFCISGFSFASGHKLIGISIASNDHNQSLAQNIANHPENLSVKIELEDQSWLEVVVDGKTTFKGELPKGTNRTWSAKQELTLRTGNAGGVLVALNDQQAQKLGQPGQIQEITYKAP